MHDFEKMYDEDGLICKICRIMVFNGDRGKIVLFSARNGYKPWDVQSTKYAEDITCEEFIIKNIIE